MIKKFLSFIACLCACEAHSAQIINVEYVHDLIKQQWGIDLAYNPQLTNPGVAANMKYLLTAIDVTNEMLNGKKTTDYGNGSFATNVAADLDATHAAVESLIKYEKPIVILLDSDDGKGGNTSVSCSGSECVLPRPSTTKSNQAFTGNWCSEKNGAGTCWVVGKTYKASELALFDTLYAQWAPVYQITVIAQTSEEFKNSGIPKPESFYLMYGHKWCADSLCETTLTKLTEIPEFVGYNFAGIKTLAMYGGVKSNLIVDEEGNFVMDEAALTTAPKNANAQVQWERGVTYCAPGTYYIGHYNSSYYTYCQKCVKGSYCPGGNFATTYGSYSAKAGLESCPAGTATTVAGATSESDCVAQ